MKIQNSNYIPALKYTWLTQFYDKLISAFLREKLWKQLVIVSIINSKSEKILDVGCGTATLTIMLKNEFPQTSVTGIDGDSKILAIADKKVKSAMRNIALQKAYSYALPFPDNHFDVVVSSLMLHHLSDENKNKTMLEINRVLKPGGQCVIADWGKPNNLLIRWLFYLVQLLDGFSTTRANVMGLLPAMLIDNGFVTIKELHRIPTILGSISIISSKKP